MTATLDLAAEFGLERSALATERLAHELRSIALRYAAGVDRGDADLFLSAFHPDGALVSYDRRDHSLPTRRREGPAELGSIAPTVAAKYSRTYHVVGNTEYHVSDFVAVGEVYCVAHHYSEGPAGAIDHVMYIRYRDRYECREGRWAIAERRHRVDWTESRIADPIG